MLRDVPCLPVELIRSADKDHARISMFPSLDYRGLYKVIIQFFEVLPQFQSGMQGTNAYNSNFKLIIDYFNKAVGQTILHTLGCLVPFLEHELMDSLPYIVASSIPVLPNSMHKDLLDLLCYNLLPFTIGNLLFIIYYINLY